MKNLHIKFSWQFRPIFLFFSPGKAKTCKPGQVDDVFKKSFTTQLKVSPQYEAF